jgi:hypothetical protein
MKMVIYLGKLKLNTLFGYGKELVGYVDAAGIPVLLTSKPYVQMNDSLVKLNEGYELTRKSAFTDMLFDLDQKCDRSYRSFSYGVQSFIYSDIPAEAQAAKTLNVLLEQYGTAFLDEPYLNESGKMSKFIEELKQPMNAAAVATLKLESRQAQLTNDAASVSAVLGQSSAEKGARSTYVAATKVRTEFEKAASTFLNYVEIKLLEESDPKWEALCEKIVGLNERLEKSEALRLAALKSKREEEKKKSEGQK